MWLRLRKWGALLVALVLAALVIDQQLHPDEVDADADAIAAPLNRRHQPDANAEAAASEIAPADAPPPLIRTDRLQAREAGAAGPVADLFASRSWLPPTPKPAPVPPPPPPQAPPFPYAYMGGMSDEGRLTAYFGAGERVIVVRAGDVINAVYRVDSINSGQMKLTYLPLNQQLVIPIGALR
jgi:hypothetical protein